MGKRGDLKMMGKEKDHKLVLEKIAIWAELSISLSLL